jgi:hypothetical protein
MRRILVRRRVDWVRILLKGLDWRELLWARGGGAGAVVRLNSLHQDVDFGGKLYLFGGRVLLFLDRWGGRMSDDRGDVCGVGVVVGEEARLGVLKLPGMAMVAGIAGVTGVAGMAGMDCSLGLMLGRGGQSDGFGETSLGILV